MDHPKAIWVVRWALGTVPRILIRPWLWPTAARFIAWRSPRGTWVYMKFRFETAYGNSPGVSAEVVPFLYWARKAHRKYG